VGPALAHFGWAHYDWDRIARATMAGHLLECGAQVSGGYYADPGLKDVPDLARVGFPIAEIDSNGDCTITKADDTGGRVDKHTVKEQLLYEVHDPAAYLTPDVTADVTQARGAGARPRRRAPDRRARPPTARHAQGQRVPRARLAGRRRDLLRGAEARARLAAAILRERLAGCGPLRCDLIGVASVFGDDGGEWLSAQAAGAARDVRLRVTLNHADRAVAERLPREVSALYTCGPAGGGGVRTGLRARLGTVSCGLARESVPARFEFLA